MKRTATKRRSKEQLNVDRIIKKELILLKDNILEVAVPRSRRRPTEQGGGRLQDEMNGRVAPDTTLTMYQMVYGQWNYPRGVNSGEKNALLITMKELIPDTTKIIIKEINDIILEPFKSK
jgi:hypothetical protein